MNVTLSPELETAVRQKVASGEYDAVDDLIGEAVQRLIEEDSEERSQLARTRERIEASEAQAERGEYVEYSADDLHELVQGIRERGIRNLAAERKQTGSQE